MKIAIASENCNVCPHFGHAPFYAVFTIDESGNLLDRVDYPNPGHAPGFLPKWLGDLEVSVIIAGGMGARAEELFRSQGIEPVIGAAGNVEEAAISYCRGTLVKGPSACSHGKEEGEHRCEDSGEGQ